MKPFNIPPSEEEDKKEKARDIRKSQDLRTRVIPPLPSSDVREVDAISLDAIKSAYVAEGLTEEEVSERFRIPLATVRAIIKEGKLIDLRGILIRDGLLKLQNRQVKHAQDLLDLEANFHKLTIQSLKVTLADKMAYLEYHGDFYRRGKDGEILKDRDGIPKQISIPNVAKQITNLKGSLVLGEGLKRIMGEIQAVLKGQQVSREDIEMQLDDMFIETKGSMEIIEGDK